MGRKRKSQSISEADVVDLSMAYGVDEDPPSLPKPVMTEICASSIPALSYRKIRSMDDGPQFKFHLANAMSQATRSLDESARSIQMQNQHPSTNSDKRCTPCKYTDMECDLQRPFCENCRDACAGGIIIPCLYTQDIGQQAEIPYGQASNLPAHSETKEVEVIDLGSDNDEIPNGNDEEYEVEAILARRSKTKKKCIEYLVKWKEYSTDENTWEPLSNLDGAQAFINGFEAAVARTSIPDRKKPDKRPKPSGELKRSPSLGLVVIPRNPKVLEHQTSRPIPVLVKSINACRLVPADDTYEYSVNWHGLAPNQNSWEAESRFTGCRSLIQNYHLATCLDFPSDNAEEATDHSGTDSKLISAEYKSLSAAAAVLDWASELVSNEAQTAILLFVMQSRIMREQLEPYAALALHRVLTRHGIPGLAREIEINSNTAVNGQQPNTQGTRPTGRIPEISAVISHRLRTGKSMEYLVRWKHSNLDTWHSTEILAGLPEATLAMRRYLEIVKKSFVQRTPPVMVPGDGSNLTNQPDSGVAGVNGNASRLQNSSGRNEDRQIDGNTSQRTPFFKCCVECKKAKLDCDGTTRCERCVTMNLVCAYAQPTTYERQAAEVWLRNQLSQQPSRYLSEVNDMSQPSTIERVPPPSAKSTSETAWKTTPFMRDQSKQTPKNNSVGSTVNYAHLFRRSVIGKSRLGVNGAASKIISNDLRRESGPVEAQKQPDSRDMYNLTLADEKRVTEHINRTSAPLSEEVARNPSYTNGQASHSPLTQPSSVPKQPPVHKPTRSSSEERKDRNYEELKKAFVAPKKSYPTEDSYLLVKKTDAWFRPLPNGHHSRHNVASNVLLSIGKHPWLSGLNHHLIGLLNRSAGGRKIISVSGQVRNAENFRQYKAPSSMPEMTEANFRATLPMGGKPF